MNIRGSFENVIGYVQKMEQFPALVVLDNIGLKVADGQPQEIQSELQLSFFQLGVEPPAGSQTASAQGKTGGTQ